jgi:hypothetical protein
LSCTPPPIEIAPLLLTVSVEASPPARAPALAPAGAAVAVDALGRDAAAARR